LGFCFYSLQILLDPVRGGHPILFFEGGVKDGLAFESGDPIVLGVFDFFASSSPSTQADFVV